MKISHSIGIPNRNILGGGNIPSPPSSMYELEESNFLYMLEAGGFYRTEQNYIPVVETVYLLEDLSGSYDLESGAGSYLNEA